MRGLVGDTGCGGRRAAAVLMAAALTMAMAAPARAEDGGFFGFLSSTFGGRPAAPTAAPPAPPPSEGEQVRPLTVRRTPRKAARPGTSRMARVPTKTGPVSIYEDPTLRDGDAVMTKEGMRVFAGGRFTPDHPYGETDFVAVSASKAVAPTLKKTVIELNKLPHG